ncbi:hypothetical protein, partial [Pseudomonas aeruginosa]|uniref:hypothetical protein n=1 Tax=Pseudomonas aeruginosa TaxID=287 RepID=UPI00398255E1
VGLQAVAAGLADAVPYRRVVDHQRSRIGRALATSARLAALRLPPAGGQPATVFYRLTDAPHERAFNTLTLDPANGQVKSDQ